MRRRLPERQVSSQRDEREMGLSDVTFSHTKEGLLEEEDDAYQ
jgi:hypothetical protein